MPNNNALKKLMNTRKIASTAVPKGVAKIKNVMKEISQTPYYLAKQLNKIAGGKRRTRRVKKSSLRRSRRRL